MVCLACRDLGPPLCNPCLLTIRPAERVLTPGGRHVWSWAVHEGAARTLVRRLKYEAVVAIAPFVAELVVHRVPSDTEALVPVARATARRIRYGVDPARELATALADRTGLPVVDALGPPLWARANAGHRRMDRRPPDFRKRRSVGNALVVDDVMTTGTTIDAAATTLGGIVGALTVTNVP